MHLITIDGTVINLDTVMYVNLNAPHHEFDHESDSSVTTHDSVVIQFTDAGTEGASNSLKFHGKKADDLRAFFLSTAMNITGMAQ
jgi:hypothetical protein